MRTSNRRVIDLGTFELTSDRIIATDPCYADDASAPGIPAKPGTWVARVVKVEAKDWGDRCALLWAHHAAHPVGPETPAWEDTDAGTGVDSGQAGLFDKRYFNDASVVAEPVPDPLTGENEWYDLCCDRTLKDPGAGVIPYGCVSSSGLGDGGYPIFAITEGGAAVALGIDFQLLGRAFAPALEGAAADLYARTRAGDLAGVRAAVSRDPSLLEDGFFADYALYNGQEDLLVALLESAAGAPVPVDVYHVVRDENVALLRRLRPHLREIPRPYATLGALAFVSDGAVALALAEELAAAGIDLNPPPEDGWREPLAIYLARFLREGNEEALEFLISRGLDVRVKDSDGAGPLQQERLRAGTKRVLKAALSRK